MKDKNMTRKSHLGFFSWQTMLDNLTDFYNEMTGSVDKRDSKSSARLLTLSHNFCQPNKENWTGWVDCKEGWKIDWTSELEGSTVPSVTVHSVPWGLIPVGASANAFISDLDNRTEGISASLQMTPKWNNQLMLLRDVTQQDLDKQEEWTIKKLMKLNEDKCKVLYLGKSKPRINTCWGPTCWVATLQDRSHEFYRQQVACGFAVYPYSSES